MIVITGASGSLGNLVVEALSNKQSHTPIKLTSRTPEKLSSWNSKGYSVALFDFDDPASMEDALIGCSTLLLISGDSPVEKRIKQHQAAIDAAKKMGVNHIVYTSFVNPIAESLFPFATIHQQTERSLIESKISYSILRNPSYIENLAGALTHARQTGVLALPGAKGKSTYLAKQDIAKIIVELLTSNNESSSIYELSGPEAIDLFAIATLASDIWGTKVEAQVLPEENFKQMLSQVGLPEFMVTAISGLQQATAAGEYDLVSNTATQILGNKMLTIRDYLKTFA